MTLTVMSAPKAGAKMAWAKMKEESKKCGKGECYWMADISDYVRRG